MKTLPPILFALVMTGLVAGSMLAVGANALVNRNTAPVADSPAGSSTAPAPQSSPTEQLLAQYQQRDQQYQDQINEAVRRLNTANQQLQQADQEIQNYQRVLAELQQRGVIRIDNNGQIFLGHRDDD